MVVGFFTFAKLLMYLDINPEAFADHALVRTLLGCGECTGADDLALPNAESKDTDNIPFVMDADSSQTKAITRALKAGGNKNYTVKELPSLNHLLQTADTGDISEYGKIEETMSPTALQIIGDWIGDILRIDKKDGRFAPGAHSDPDPVHAETGGKFMMHISPWIDGYFFVCFPRSVS